MWLPCPVVRATVVGLNDGCVLVEWWSERLFLMRHETEGEETTREKDEELQHAN